MKYLILLADGMADRPLPQLNGCTPLEAALTPAMDRLAQAGRVGCCRTIPPGMPPGSDTANMSVLGYPPQQFYRGRSPLEALSIGVELGQEDVAMRCNLVTLSGEADIEDNTMVDYSAGEISTGEALPLVKALAQEFDRGPVRLYPGISYRHCLVLSPGQTGAILTPPHDISGQSLRGRLPRGQNSDLLRRLIQTSRIILRDHPVNQARREKGLHTADSVWFWGEGTRPALEPFEQRFGLRGGVVCAVDLLRGLGLCAKMRVLTPPGATGGMVTDYLAKADAALELLADDCDLVYIHVEAPDECGHQGEYAAKMEAIQQIDAMLSHLQRGLADIDPSHRLLLTCDHPTPIEIRTHSADPVPFVIWDSAAQLGPHAAAFSEKTAAATGLFLPSGPLLMQELTGAGEKMNDGERE